MSLSNVRLMVSDLPRALREQVLGYTESVARALPDIFREAGRKENEEIVNQVVLIVAVKKLHWLASSSFWTLDNSGKLLATFDVTRIRAGRADLSRGGDLHGELKLLLNALDQVLADQQLKDYVNMSLPELIEVLLANECR